MDAEQWAADDLADMIQPSEPIEVGSLVRPTCGIRAVFRVISFEHKARAGAWCELRTNTDKVVWFALADLRGAGHGFPHWKLRPIDEITAP